jgi:hypothetical protein
LISGELIPPTGELFVEGKRLTHAGVIACLLMRILDQFDRVVP